MNFEVLDCHELLERNDRRTDAGHVLGASHGLVPVAQIQSSMCYHKWNGKQDQLSEVLKKLLMSSIVSA